VQAGRDAEEILGERSGAVDVVGRPDSSVLLVLVRAGLFFVAQSVRGRVPLYSVLALRQIEVLLAERVDNGCLPVVAGSASAAIAPIFAGNDSDENHGENGQCRDECDEHGPPLSLWLMGRTIKRPPDKISP
jgi:hypothetical protein